MEDQFQDIPHVFNPEKPPKRFPRRTVVLISVVILLVLAFIFIKVSGSNNSNTPVASDQTNPTPDLTFTPSPLPSTSPVPSQSPASTPNPKATVNPVDKSTGLDRSQLTVAVENGSGGAGIAGKAADYLKSLGYDVISTDNADSFSYSGVVIEVKTGSSNYLSLLEKDLGFNYTIGTTSADLSSGASEDALVIIGQ